MKKRTKEEMTLYRRGLRARKKAQPVTPPKNVTTALVTPPADCHNVTPSPVTPINVVHEIVTPAIIAPPVAGDCQNCERLKARLQQEQDEGARLALELGKAKTALLLAQQPPKAEVQHSAPDESYEVSRLRQDLAQARAEANELREQLATLEDQLMDIPAAGRSSAPPDDQQDTPYSKALPLPTAASSPQVGATRTEHPQEGKVDLPHLPPVQRPLAPRQAGKAGSSKDAEALRQRVIADKVNRINTFAKGHNIGSTRA